MSKNKKKDLNKKNVSTNKEIKKIEDKEISKDKNTKEKKKKKNIILILFVILGIILILGCIGSSILVFSADFHKDKYEKNIEISYGKDEKIDIPYVCYRSFIKCKKIKPEIIGEYDYNTIGEYDIKYKYKYNDKELVLKRKILVKDKDKPEITVNEETIKVCPNGKICNLEVEAIDNVDGDITDKVVSEVKDKKLIVKVKDSSDNEMIKEYDVNPEDKEGPVITLNGNSSESIIVGSTYTDKGASAVDNCDGEVKVSTSGEVDSSKVGEYKIIYSAEDSSGNKSSKERKVVVKEKVVVRRTVYLTFDDGPGAYTKQLLDILDKYNVKVTFFVTNQFPKYQYLIGEEAKRGHTVAVHTLTHKWNIYDSLDSYLNDFNAMNDIIEQQTGSRTKIFRFPGGSSNSVYCSHNKTAVPDIVNYMNENGIVYFDWNVSSGDAGGTTSSDMVYSNVISGVNARSTSVVLQHDIKSYSVNAVERIIKYGLNNGYEFKALEVDSPVVHHGIKTCK